MNEASQRLREHVERPDRTFDAEDRARHRELVDQLNLSIADFMEACERAFREQ